MLDQLPPESAARLRENAQVREYRRHETVYQEGDLIAGPAWVHWGLIRAYHTHPDGREYTMLVGWPGELSTPTFSGRQEWPLAAVALTPMVRVIVPSGVMEDICRRDPRVTRALLHMLATDSHERYRWMAYLMSVPLRTRLARILSRMGEQLGTPSEDGVLLDFPVVQEDLAIIARVTRDETGRVVREMLQAELIGRVPGRRLVILNQQGLEEWCTGR
jgi:CRP-like cAMP-binding protein